MKPLYKYLIVFSALIAGYLLFGAGAWLMPDRAVQRHVRETLDKGDMESDQPRAVLPHMMQTRMDNFTDAIILNQAYVMRLEGFRTGVLSVPRWWGPLLPYEVLRAGVDGQEMQIRHYARYWHGNTFLTRYLLVFYDYMDIRLLLYIVSTLLMVWCGASLWRRQGWQTALAVMFGLAVCYAFVMQFSMQFAPVLIIALAGMIAVSRGCNAMMTAFVVGSLTCFFDLLTAPMLTLGALLVVQAAMSTEEKVWRGWWNTCRAALLWALGYGGTWVTKWVIATVFTAENVIVDGIENTFGRASGLEDFTRWDALMNNIELLPWRHMIEPLLAVLVVLALVCFNAKGWRKALQILPIAVLPWVWYLFAANHSYWHNWFTFRAQAVTVAAMLLAVAQMVDWRRLRVKKKI